MGVTHSRQKRGKTFLLDFSVDGRTAIRFFYNPVGNYFHFPLIFFEQSSRETILGRYSSQEA